MDLISILDYLNNLSFLSKLPIDSMTLSILLLVIAHIMKYTIKKAESIAKFAYTQWEDAQRKKIIKKIILNDLNLQFNNLYSLMSAFESCMENEQCYPFSKIPNQNFATLNKRVFEQYPLADYNSIFRKKYYDYQELNCLYDQLELFRKRTPADIIREYSEQSARVTSAFTHSRPNLIYNKSLVKEDCKGEFERQLKEMSYIIECMAKFIDAYSPTPLWKTFLQW